MKATEFYVSKTDIEGLLVFDISFVEDTRGWFMEKFQKQKLTALGLPPGFDPVQHNISFNLKKGTTRGIHAEPWGKYVGIIAGSAHCVFVDLRKKNFGKVFEMTLDEKKTVFIPAGVGNSYQTLKPRTYYSYLVNEYWQPGTNYVGVNLADPRLAINWPIPLKKAIISDKDKNNPNLSDIKPL